jgi:hypothetical protein
MVTKDEPKGGGLVREPFQWTLRQRVARVSLANVRVGADEPALLHLVDRPLGRTGLACSDRSGPERRLEAFAMFVQRKCVKGVLVVEAQMGVEEPISADLG